MSENWTRYENSKRMMLHAIEIIDDKDKLVEAILEYASRMLFWKQYPHIEREFRAIDQFLDSVGKHIIALEDKVEELEKKLADK